MFEWLNKLFDWILQWLPTRELLGPNEGGVRITCIPHLYKSIRVLDMGCWWYWPIIQNIQKQVIVTQVLNLPEQALNTIDNKVVVTQWAIQYYVRAREVDKALLNVEDVDEVLAVLAMKAIAGYIRKKKLIECSEQDIEDEIVKATKEEIGKWGLQLQKIFPLQFVNGRVLRLFIDSAEKYGRIIR